MTQLLINHIAFVLDVSGSMSGKLQQVERVFDREIKNLRSKSEEFDQETRISVYTFNNNVLCNMADRDVKRDVSMSGKLGRASGRTAMIDAMITAIDDLNEIPTKYGDHSFLIYLLTDGQENASRQDATKLVEKLKRLDDRFTVACLVPSVLDKRTAHQYGIPNENIQVWDTNDAMEIERVGQQFTKSMSDYIVKRSQGVRSTKTFFAFQDIDKAAVKKNLVELEPGTYKFYNVHGKMAQPIKEFVESWTGAGTYRIGSAYFMLTKPETIQTHKQVCVREKATGKVYAGASARQLLGLPNYEVKVAPANYRDFDIFVQSTSVNRNLIPGTLVLVIP